MGSTITASFSEITNSGDFISGSGNAAEFLDDIRVYSTAKTAQDIEDIYNIPEPSTLALLTIVLPCLAVFARRRRR